MSLKRQNDLNSKVISAEECLRAMEQNLSKKNHYAFDFEDMVDQSDRQVSLRDHIVELAEDGDFVASTPGSGLSLHQNLRSFANSLREDISQILPANLRNTWLDTLIGILPLGTVNGCVLIRHHNLVLDKYLIVLNYGLTFGCQAIADGLAIEILQGEMEAYRGDGAPSFLSAVAFHLEPNKLNLDRLLTPRNFPAEVEAEFATHAGALCSIMLKFVALHELGHIVNGDCENDNGVFQLSSTQNDRTQVQYARSEILSHENWSAELAADRFALQHLCDWKSGALSCWPNVAQIYLFFSWLEYCELRKGALLCPFHPPASMRKKQIVDVAYELANAYPAEDYFSQIDDLIVRWTGGAQSRKV